MIPFDPTAMGGPPLGDIHSLARLREAIDQCRLCPRLVDYRERVAREKKRAYRDEDYWGRPLSGFGDPHARLIIVGLAPAAHGGNRTGRMFTGDSSADFLHAGLYRHGLSNQPTSRHRNDGLRLTGVYITAAVRCAPPANRPTPQEQATCLPYLVRELQLLSRWRVLLALGQIAFDACLKAAVALGEEVPSPRPRFRHGATVVMGRVILVASYHPSRQNTQTGRLTPAMLDTVIGHACRLAGISSSMHASPSRLQTGRGGA